MSNTADRVHAILLDAYDRQLAQTQKVEEENAQLKDLAEGNAQLKEEVARLRGLMDSHGMYSSDKELKNG